MKSRIAPWVVAALSLAVLLLGADAFWFEVDDAFIAYRYVAQSRAGHGYVWNAPPFLPVEGYSSFAWVALLDLAWRLTGLPPTRTACVLSLACMVATFALTASTMWRRLASWRTPSARLGVFGLVLLWLVTNRTLLVFCTSGLETGLWVLLGTAWALAGLTHRPRALVALAALMMLTRPEGALAVVVSVGAVALEARKSRDVRRLALTLLPLLLPLAHLVWRRWFYGGWVPNTGAAKLVKPWPEAGAMYFASFIVEYGLAPLLAAALVAGGRHRARLREVPQAATPWAVTLGAAGYLAFYGVIAGGDLFEYRPLAPLVPWIAIAMVVAATRSARPTRTIALVLAVQVALSAYIPWQQWRLTSASSGSRLAGAMVVPVAPVSPLPLRPWVSVWDGMQRWLLARYINSRHSYHRSGTALLFRGLPPPASSPRPRPGQHAVLVADAVGVVGWSLPRLDVIDYHGLCDWVIARTPPVPSGDRHLAHERTPPPGYLRAYRPYFAWTPGVGLQRRPSGGLLSDDEVRAVERHWRAQVTAPR
jgi:arabinofuranosyltransferase